MTGRLFFLVILSLPIVAGSSVLIALVSHPSRSWVMGLGVELRSIVAIPFGLAVGALLPRELEATLVLIGVVGIQSASMSRKDSPKVLPFYASVRLLDSSLGGTYPVGEAMVVSLSYGAALLAASFFVVVKRIRVRRHPPPLPVPLFHDAEFQEVHRLLDGGRERRRPASRIRLDPVSRISRRGVNHQAGLERSVPCPGEESD